MLPEENIDIISSHFSQLLTIRLLNRFFEISTRKYLQENFTFNLRDFKISQGIRYYEPLRVRCDEKVSNKGDLIHAEDISNYKLYRIKNNKGFIYIRSTAFLDSSDNTFNYCEHTILHDFIHSEKLFRPKHIILHYTCNVTNEQIAELVEDNPQIESLKIIIHNQEKQRTNQIMEKLATLKHIKLLSIMFPNNYYDDLNVNLVLKILTTKIIFDTCRLKQEHLNMIFQNSKLTSLILRSTCSEIINKEILIFLFEKIYERSLEKLILWNFEKKHIKTENLKSVFLQKLKTVKDVNCERGYNYISLLDYIVVNNHLESFSFYCNKINLKKLQDFVEKKRNNPLSKLKKLKIYYSNAKFIKSHDEIMNILGHDFEMSFKRI